MYLGLLKSPFLLLGFTVQVIDVPFDTVRMCVAGGMDANVFACFSVDGTGMRGVTVRLFFPDGAMGDPRFVLIFCSSPGVSGWSFCLAALSLLGGFGAARSSVPEAQTCLLSLSVLCGLLPVPSILSSVSFSGPGICRRPGRGINTGLVTLAFQRYLFDLVCWCVPPSRAGYEYGALRAGKLRCLSWFVFDCRRPGRGTNTGLAQLASHDLRGQHGAGFSCLLGRHHVCCRHIREVCVPCFMRRSMLMRCNSVQSAVCGILLQVWLSRLLSCTIERCV